MIRASRNRSSPGTPAAMLCLMVAIVSSARAEDPPPPRKLTLALPADTLADEMNRMAADGFRPVDACLWAENGRLLAAVVWEKRERPEYRFYYGLPRDEFKEQVTALGKGGYRLVHLGSAAAAKELYHGIWEKGEPQQLTIRYGFPAAEAVKVHEKLSADGHKLFAITGLPRGRSAANTLAWDRRPGPAPELDVNISERLVRRRLRQRDAEGYRLSHLDMHLAGRAVRFSCVWEKDDGIEQEVELGVTAAGLKKNHETNSGDGFRLAQVRACLVAGRARFAAVWEKPAK